MLAGLMKAPSKLAPDRNPDGRHRARGAGHHRHGAGGLHHRRDGQARPRRTRPQRVANSGAGSINYAADYVMDVLDDTIGAIDEDIVVTTTLDPRSRAPPRRRSTEELDKKGDEIRRLAGRVRRARSDRRASARWSAAAIMPRASSTAPSRPSASRARPSSPSSISPALEHGLTPDTVREDGAAQRQGLAAGKLQPRIFRARHADQGAVAVAEYGGGARSASRSARRRSSRPRIGSASRPTCSPTPPSRSAPRKSRRWNWSPPMRLSPMAASACSRTSSRKVQHGRRQAALPAQGRQQRPRDRAAICGDDERHDAGDAAHRHGAQGASFPAGRRPARPAPARISATPGSSATRASSSPASGSAMTIIRRRKKPRAAICRSKSGAAS